MTRADPPTLKGLCSPRATRRDGHWTTTSGDSQVVQDLVGKWPSKLLLSHAEMTPNRRFPIITIVIIAKATGCEGI